MTAADLTELLGPIPLDRIVWDPFPGTATFEDCVRLNEGDGDHLCELIDGVLLEKAVGWTESEIGLRFGIRVGLWDPDERRGRRTGADGFMRLSNGRVRGPDFSFFSWSRFPDPAAPVDPIPSLTPDFCVEVLSESNTRQEIDGKLDDLFAGGPEHGGPEQGGCRLAWVIDPHARTARIVVPADNADAERPWVEAIVDETATLSGDPVLSGFAVTLAELLAIPASPDGDGEPG